MVQLSRIAPLAAGIWRRTPPWLRGAITWTVNGKVIVGVSGVLLNEEGQVLLLRHRFHNNRIWGLPGGWLSPGETVYDCWRREVKEELALDTSIEGIVCHRATRRVLEFYLLGRIRGGQLNIDPVEILEARFFAVDELPPMELFSTQVIGRALIQVEEAMDRSGAGRSDRTRRSGKEKSLSRSYPTSGREEKTDAGPEERDATGA